MNKPTIVFGPRMMTAIFAVIAIIALTVAAADHKSYQESDDPKQGIAIAKTAPKSAVSVRALKAATVSADSLMPLGTAIGQYLDKNDPGSSVYLEGLESHVALNVGETHAYNTKSLMKVPLVMSLYKASELGRLNLDDTITLTPSEIDKTFGDLWQKKAGYQLTLRQAASYALKSSDNTAIRAINDHVFSVVPPKERAYEAIGLSYRVDEKGDTYISTASYATVFRCLHEACYNNRLNSDEMLGLMKQSDFTAPMQLLPKGIKVAHKIGNVGPEGYNDCGIVYGAKSPFMFCMMLTKSEPQVDDTIADLTKMAYDYFEK